MEWQALRERVLRRDWGFCQNCHAIATEVHHIVPRHKGGLDVLDNLVSLCHTCHIFLEPRDIPLPKPGRKITWEISKDVLIKVKHEAIEKDLSTSALVSRILEEYLSDKRK